MKGSIQILYGAMPGDNIVHVLRFVGMVGCVSTRRKREYPGKEIFGLPSLLPIGTWRKASLTPSITTEVFLTSLRDLMIMYCLFNLN
jgi:hypothetical protein